MATADPTPETCRILLISGSLRRGSTNAAVLNTAQVLVPAGVTAVMYEGLAELPHFNPDDESTSLPAPVVKLRAMLDDADGVFFSTPEYAGSLPGSFKNLLDWTVGAGLYRKPVAFITSQAKGAHDTMFVVLGFISADVVKDACAPIPVRRDAVGPDGIIQDLETRERISAALTTLVNHIAQLKS